MINNTCLICEAAFQSGRASKYCTRKCRDAARIKASKVTCRDCGVPMFPSASAVQGKSICRPCRKELHGTSTAYARGCRCDECSAAKAADMRRFHDRYRSESGLNYSTVWRKRFRVENGFWPHMNGGDWIDPRERRSLYERDGWSCYLCGELLSATTDFNNPKALTLDHVLPRSRGGSNDHGNLKTCCRECNVLKGAKVTA